MFCPARTAVRKTASHTCMRVLDVRAPAPSLIISWPCSFRCLMLWRETSERREEEKDGEWRVAWNVRSAVVSTHHQELQLKAYTQHFFCRTCAQCASAAWRKGRDAEA